ncbi:MAG: hypothetical protein D6732_20935 [Methanobacteriota archaeon]|nr:MAG: hypothetical protein D6732_20935 [Euryarchaeota archaeon]
MIKFHPAIQSSYLETHEWLAQLEGLPPYRKNNARSKVKKILQEPTLESAALQYYVLFPGHFAKVAFALREIIGVEHLVNWLSYSSSVTVIDIGCGTGAASSAFVNCLLEMRENSELKHPISVHLIGVDPNVYAIAIYSHLIEFIKPRTAYYGIDITYQKIPKRDLPAIIQLKEFLSKQCTDKGIPFLPHVFLFQANVVSPFSARYKESEEKRKIMASLGVLSDDVNDAQDAFGKEEALAYKQIVEDAFVDNLHIVTVGTDGYEQLVYDLSQAIDNEFQGKNHIVNKIGNGEYSVEYSIPEGCYWREFKKTEKWKREFCASVSSISSVALADEDWEKVQSTKNLKTAWARARRHLLEQVLVDEIEIRIFESDLDANLYRLQQQLVAYAQDVVRADDRLHFKFPKSNNKLRPLGLSRIEEEILSTALIQRLGEKISGLMSRSYAYKFSRTYGDYDTEYLYAPWFDSYKKYIADARSAALDKNNTNGVVIQVDIKSFYTRIVRSTLTELSRGQLSRSPRVEWLLKVLFSRDLVEHEPGKGIVQGNIASGFFANLYLTSIDARFGLGNEWGLQFFRYVDDMIFVVPEPESVPDVLETLRQELGKLDLELNSDKTDIFTVDEFIEATEDNEMLDNLQKRFQAWLNCLWILDENHRQVFRKAYNGSQSEWWYRVGVYRAGLLSIGITIDATQLSRRIYKYLFNDKLCQRDFSWEQPFELPTLPDNASEEQISNWKKHFNDINVAWLKEKQSLSDTFYGLLVDSQKGMQKAIDEQDVRSEKQWQRVFRFALNKIVQFDFRRDDAIQIVVGVLRESPWLMRYPHKFIDSLAVHGYSDQIENLLTHYEDETDVVNEYMKSVLLRSIQFLSDIPENLWTQVVKNATSQSSVVSLMATETWLKVVQSQNKSVSEAHLQQIELAFTSNPITRLKKNYLLILGEHKREVTLHDGGDEQDFLLENVRNIIQSENVGALFDYYEPEILAREFYSGYRFDYDNPSL